MATLETTEHEKIKHRFRKAIKKIFGTKMQEMFNKMQDTFQFKNALQSSPSESRNKKGKGTFKSYRKSK